MDGILAAITEGHTWNLKNEIADITQEYAEKTLATLSSKTYPIFDPDISDVIARLVDQSLILPTPSARARSTQGGLASHLLRRLPNFEKASMDEVLDIREELSKPLRNFRRGVNDYAKEIETEAWTPEFQYEAERVFEERVKDAIDELDEEVRANRSLREFGIRSGTVGVVEAPGMLALFISSPTSIDILAALLWGGSSALVAQVMRRHKSAEHQKNQLYFYHAAKKRLAR